MSRLSGQLRKETPLYSASIDIRLISRLEASDEVDSVVQEPLLGHSHLRGTTHMTAETVPTVPAHDPEAS
jgi:hypothetical protein